MLRPPHLLAAPRGGQTKSTFINDDLLQQFCMGRLHTWFGETSSPTVALKAAAKGVYEYDAILGAILGLFRRIEYKWDRHALSNLVGELVAKDRGADADLGYLFKQGYDWLAYGYIKHDVIYFFEAQSARQYAFDIRRERDVGATHCANANRDGTASWNLLIPVNRMYLVLSKRGRAFRMQVPRGLLDPDHAFVASPQSEQLRRDAEVLLERVLHCPLEQPWYPKAGLHWPGMVEHLQVKNALRDHFDASEIAQSEHATRDWCAMALTQGLMLP